MGLAVPCCGLPGLGGVGAWAEGLGYCLLGKAGGQREAVGAWASIPRQMAFQVVFPDPAQAWSKVTWGVSARAIISPTDPAPCQETASFQES